ncbi:DNA-binding protein [Propionivibrio sp.]|uniref:DNA-binding protein n=1 Tax=Propionivibrio sp. TaxID=2212460 RepID=UPI003BF1A4A9
MAKSSEVSPEAVATACVELWAAGESTSFNNVYDKIGRLGSAAIVQRYIAQWRKDSAERLSAKRTLPDLPTDLVTASDELLGKTWALALGQAEAAYSEAHRRLAGVRAEIEAALELANQKTAQAEFESLRLAGDIQGLQAQLDAKNDLLQDALKNLGESSVALATREDQIVGLREDLARALTTIASDRDRYAADLASTRDHHVQELATERQRGDEKLADAQAKYQAELDRVQAMAQGDRLHLMAQTDEIRLAARIKADELKEQLENAKAYAEGYRREAYAARDEASSWRGKSEVMQETIAVERARAEAAERVLQSRQSPEYPVVQPAESGEALG